MLFLLDFDEAWADVLSGDGVIIATDETYIESEIKPTHSIHLAGNPYFKGAKAKALPQKLAVIHGFTRHGFLTKYINGVPFRADVNDKNKRDSAEFIFQGSAVDFNNETFVMWLTNALIPTAQAEFPGKKVYVLFDNASFHTSADAEFFDVRKAARTTIIGKLRELGCVTLKYNTGNRTADGRVEVKEATLNEAVITYQNREMFKDKFKELNDPDILMLAATRWLHQNGHGGLLQNKVEKLLSSVGMKAIWNAPYMSQWNPIELGWAGGKGYAASLYKPSRVFSELVAHFRDGMYLPATGVKNGPRGYVKDDPNDPASLCTAAAKIFDHTVKVMNEYIKDYVPDVAPPPEGVPAVTSMTRWLEGEMGSLKAHPELEEIRAAFCGTRASRLWYITWHGRWYGSTELEEGEYGHGEDGGVV
jgi:hypothetical protein